MKIIKIYHGPTLIYEQCHICKSKEVVADPTIKTRNQLVCQVCKNSWEANPKYPKQNCNFTTKEK
jgi:hypothetical protein